MKRLTFTSFLFFFFALLSFVSNSVFAQETFSSYGPIDERLLVETKWKYTYTLQVESNTIIHKADEHYDFFLYWRYDYSYQEYLNGKLTKGMWKLSNRTLFYKFRHISSFEIAALNKKVLVLEFTQPSAKGTYQYHFIRVESKEAPFVKPYNELPDVIVEAINPHKKKKERQKLALRKKKKRKKGIAVPEEEPVYINIELTGGGYYGGIDPVLKDYIHIKSNGRLIKEFQSVYNGLIVTKKNIPREELEQFAEFIVKQKFFDFERIYDCEDLACLKRKSIKPKPVPLRLSVSYGNRKKVVMISIWGKDKRDRKYVNYPPSLDNIIDGIQRIANRLDDQMVRR